MSSRSCSWGYWSCSYCPREYGEWFPCLMRWQREFEPPAADVYADPPRMHCANFLCTAWKVVEHEGARLLRAYADDPMRKCELVSASYQDMDELPDVITDVAGGGYNVQAGIVLTFTDGCLNP